MTNLLIFTTLLAGAYLGASMGIWLIAQLWT